MNNRFLRFYRTSIGGKLVVALTGLALVGFVVGHLLGNLLVFQGRDAFNSYAETLKNLGPLLWVVRAGLLGVFILHVVTAIRLARGNAAARPTSYHAESTVQAPFASKHMLLTGLLVLSFVLLHLLHFTMGVIHPTDYALSESLVRNGETLSRHDAFGMLVRGFRSDLLVLVYVVSMVVLGLHLSHGIASVFQTLGLNHPGYTPIIQKVGVILAWVLAVGFLLIPLTVRLGLVGQGVAS